MPVTHKALVTEEERPCDLSQQRPLPSLDDLRTNLTNSSSRAPSHGVCPVQESLIDSTSSLSDLRGPSQGHDPSNTWPEEWGLLETDGPPPRGPYIIPERAVLFVYSVLTWEGPGQDADGKSDPLENAAGGSGLPGLFH